MSFALRSAAYDVAVAVDGCDALSKLSEEIHLIITDLNMPRMDGIELIKQVRTNSKHRYIPILVLTTESQPAKMQEAKSAGATEWIVKPIRPEQWLAVIQRVLG